MHRFAADHSDDFFPAAGQDLDTLAKKNLIPPSAYRDELDEAVQCDVLHHEAHFIHVPGDHHPRPFIAMGADYRSVLVCGQRADVRELVHEYRADLVFVAGYGMCFGEFLK